MNGMICSWHTWNDDRSPCLAFRTRWEGQGVYLDKDVSVCLDKARFNASAYYEKAYMENHYGHIKHNTIYA